MKSICGYWALDGAPTPPEALAAMRIARVNHANPHLEAWRDEDGAIAFGSAWWSPQPGLQPAECLARHPETGCVVVADARLDAPAGLRAALDLPAPDDAPDATCDHAATLILHAWLRWGEACVDHLDGDFAFAVHDSRARCLFLARDRMGVRPLYVHHVPGQLLVFGSTAHAVLAHPRVPQDINEARIADFLIDGLEGVDFTSTFHLAVERHPPRHTLRITPENHRPRRYWHLEPGRAGPLPNGDDAWAEALTDVLEAAVAQCLRGPERVGSMLSGGMDSTSLAIIAGEQLRAFGKPPLPTYSVIHSQLPGSLETQAIRHLLEMPIFRPSVSDLADLGDSLPGLLRFPDTCDEPFDAIMPMLQLLYQAAARDGVGAVIDGNDGDSLLRNANAIARQLRQGHWASALGNASGLARLYGGGAFRHYLLPGLRTALIPNVLREWAHPRRMRRIHRQWLDASLVHPDFAARIRLTERLERLHALREAALLSDPARETSDALMHTFPTVGMERYHRIAMQHGITPLHPFAQRQVLELGVNLPVGQRLRKGWTKAVLRHAMRGRMPEPVRLRHDKQSLGFFATLLLWQRRCGEEAAPLSLWKPGLTRYLDPRKLQALTGQQETALRSGRASHHAVYARILDHWLPA